MKKNILLLVLILITITECYSQSQTYPYSYHLYQRINSTLYSTGTRLHTSIKPIQFNDSISYYALDSIQGVTIDSTKKSWVLRKLYNEHLVQIEKEDFKVYIDFLPDFQVGRDLNKGTTWLNTRGYQIQGSIGKKFSFYSSGYENQGRFPRYLTEFIDSNKIIPGLVNDKFGSSRNTKDWAYATAIINYTANKHFSFTLGQDKNFIGDGYRSMLLSDVAANYPFFKIETTLGNVKYLNIWAQFQDLKSPQLSYDNGFRKKWGVFHYLDWNVNDRLSLGFFDAVIWQGSDEAGKRGFDVSYLNPIIFLRTVEGANGSPDNALVGFNGKYKAAKNITVYGQFLLDEFTASEFFDGNGYWANKFGIQAGLKGFDAFKIKDLNFLAEVNTARPYTYSQRKSLINYGHYNQPLAHPFGANFREFLSIWDFTFKRWQIYAQGNYAQYGLDAEAVNSGKDIFKSYIHSDNNSRSKYGNTTAQGILTDFLYLDGRISYLINPKMNLRLEAGAVYRKESNSLEMNRTNWITLGLRSSLRNLYQDF